MDNPIFVTGLREDPLDVTALNRLVRRDDCGAVVTFEGRVRSPNKGHVVTELFYEAYEERAEMQLLALTRDAAARYGLGGVVAIHRTGTVAVGDVAVIVTAVAAHRDAAFEATRWMIDTIKADVAIWKKEITTTGESWI